MSGAKEAVEAIVEAFGSGRIEDYFAGFDPDATFVFYTSPERLGSVQEYRDLWSSWVEKSGFRVIECRTSDTLIQDFGSMAIVTHSVQTEIETNEGRETLRERETIVLAQRPDGRWLAVHEHLSPLEPAPLAEA